jgi:membrane-bound inhibitor of C-type lysozyme
MNKKPIIWSTIIILIIISVGAYLFINSQKKSSAGDIVNFYCQEGNLKAQFGKNYVVITFADGKNILLPQATSGSGIRYEMGSTTFIGEGDNASLTEGNKTTYTNCIAGNISTNNNTNTFTDNGKTFSFAYPNQYILHGGDFGYSQDWSYATNNSDMGLLLARVDIPRTFFTGKTNFGEAKFTVGTSADPDAVKSCLKYQYGETGTTTTVTINGRQFAKIQFTDVGAGNYYDVTSYRTVYNEQCYAVEYIVHSSNIYNYDPSQGVKEFDKAKITSVLEGIARGFKFIQ